MFIWKLINSPFKLPKIKFYLGKVKHGTPYFLPRKAVNFTMEESRVKATEWVNDKKSFWFGEDLDKVIKIHNSKYLKFVPKTIGFDVVRLGYKYKFDSIRFEWNPMFSFVFFGLQFCIIVKPEHESQYWESWVYYHKHTDKTKSTRERIEQCKEEAPQTWISSRDGRTEYYDLILKDKWKTKK